MEVPDFSNIATGYTPTIGRGGFLRNFHGECIVSHPDGGARTLIYEGASSLLEFKPYRGDPAHGERGQLVHGICDAADKLEPVDRAWFERGEALGVSAELQTYIGFEWIEFRRTLGISTVSVEQTVVVDEYRIASNIDRVDRFPDGRIAVGDIKTAKDYVKAAYLVQLAAYTRSVPYDVETGKRGTWDTPLERDTAFIYWFPILAAMRAEPADWPTWSLVRLDLAAGHVLLDTLFAIRRDATHRAAFTLVAPSTSPDVEHDTEGAAHGSVAPSVAPGWRADVKARYALIADLEREVDEGGDADPEAKRLLIEATKALGDVERGWVTSCNAKVRMAAVSSVRRFEALRGLLLLADNGFDQDDALRAICWYFLGDVAHFANVHPAQLLGALDVTEMTELAVMCERLADGHGSMRFDADARCFIDGLKAA
jgi:hypothetical protein